MVAGAARNSTSFDGYLGSGLLPVEWKGELIFSLVMEYATTVATADLIRPEHIRLPQSGAAREESSGDLISLRLEFTPEEFFLDAVNRWVIAWALNSTLSHSRHC